MVARTVGRVVTGRCGNPLAGLEFDRADAIGRCERAVGPRISRKPPGTRRMGGSRPHALRHGGVGTSSPEKSGHDFNVSGYDARYGRCSLSPVNHAPGTGQDLLVG